MPDPGFSWLDPRTWVTSIVAGGLALYTLVRVLRRDQRQDHNERQVDSATQQIITALRGEVERLTARVANMEAEIVRLHEERKEYREREAVLMAKLAEYESAGRQAKLL